MGVFDSAWLVAAVLAATPLLLAAMGELVSERTGVLNVGLEGMMIVGAFFGFVGAEETGSWLAGAALGTVAGALVGVLAGVLAVWARADQIVVGIAVNLLALSLTAFLFNQMYTTSAVRGAIERPERIAIPLLSELPVVGDALFNQQLFVYAAVAWTVLVWLTLSRSGWGISARAVGENPEAADSAGLRVGSIRVAGAAIAGGSAGIAGAFLSVGQVGVFSQGMSAGRGFLALAAVIFGSWRPLGVLGACLVFGAADAVQFRLQARGDVPQEVWLVLALAALVLLVHLLRVPVRGDRTARWWASRLAVASVAVVGLVGAVAGFDVAMPAQLWLALPYVLTLVVLGGFVGSARVPSALGSPYVRGRSDI
jgi:ABC-type uncharacterized transport system permease subunit